MEKTAGNKKRPNLPEIYKKLFGNCPISLEELHKFAEEGIIRMEKEKSGSSISISVSKMQDAREYRWGLIKRHLEKRCGFFALPGRTIWLNTWKEESWSYDIAD